MALLAGARRGDEGDLDPARRPATPARFVHFDRIWSWPKPAQWPHPPVLVGGNGPTVLDRVLAFGDVWFPNSARGNGIDRIPELHEQAEPRHPGARVMGAPADARELEQMRDAGVAARRPLGCRPPAARGSSRRSSATRPRSRSSTASERDGSRAVRDGARGAARHRRAGRTAHRPDRVRGRRRHRSTTRSTTSPSATTALKRIANLRADPRASVLADAYDEDWSRLWWVRADGHRADPAARPCRGDRAAARALPAVPPTAPQGPVVAIDVSRWSEWSATPDADIDFVRLSRTKSTSALDQEPTREVVRGRDLEVRGRRRHHDDACRRSAPPARRRRSRRPARRRRRRARARAPRGGTPAASGSPTAASGRASRSRAGPGPPP